MYLEEALWVRRLGTDNSFLIYQHRKVERT